MHKICLCVCVCAALSTKSLLHKRTRSAPLKKTTNVSPQQMHHKISAMEHEMRSLHEAAELFEISPLPDYKQLRACRRELGLLKSLWDMVSLVQSSFKDWNTTLWKDINVENMELECKKFVKVRERVAVNTWEVLALVHTYTCMRT